MSIFVFLADIKNLRSFRFVVTFLFLKFAFLFFDDTSCDFVFVFTNLMRTTSSWINKIFLQYPCKIFHLKLHTSFPQSFRYSCSNPKPNKNVFFHAPAVFGTALRTAVVFSSTFRTKTCTTLKLRERSVFIYKNRNWKLFLTFLIL